MNEQTQLAEKTIKSLLKDYGVQDYDYMVFSYPKNNDGWCLSVSNTEWLADVAAPRIELTLYEQPADTDITKEQLTHRINKSMAYLKRGNSAIARKNGVGMV